MGLTPNRRVSTCCAVLFVVCLGHGMDHRLVLSVLPKPGFGRGIEILRSSIKLRKKKVRTPLPCY